MSYKERAKRQREIEILKVASDLMYERGFINFNMDELAEAVGVSKPTLYQHFASKDELLVRVVLQGHEEIEALFDAPLQGTALERIEAVMHMMLQRRHIAKGGMANFGLIFPILKASPLFNEHQARLRNRLYALVEAAKQNGEIVPTLPTPLVVSAMFVLQGSVAEHHMPERANWTEEETAQMAEHVVQLYLRGITPRS
ncbi:MAG: TetR/AcrR family transcriptional regulator [Anaerolineae bacterium]|nr:TetR/AcrR family transcriptional regulator [Anaerolineae bacterium]